MLFHYFQETGYDAVVAEDGWKGIHSVLNIRPGIILMDVKMPVVDGLVALQSIRHMEALKPGEGRPVVILMSGYVDKAQVLKAKGLAVDSIVAKPFQLDELRKRIENILATRDQRS